jgi:hypothetical protein
VLNNPVKYTDPSGHFSVPITYDNGHSQQTIDVDIPGATLGSGSGSYTFNMGPYSINYSYSWSKSVMQTGYKGTVDGMPYESSDYSVSYFSFFESTMTSVENFRDDVGDAFLVSNLMTGFFGAVPSWASSQLYNKAGNTIRWKGVNGKVYNSSKINRWSGGLKNSMNLAKTRSRVVRNVGNFASGAGVFLTVGYAVYEVGAGTANTHTIVNTVIGVGIGAAAIFGSPVIITGAIVVGLGWGVFSMVGGEWLDKKIDSSIGFRR